MHIKHTAIGLAVASVLALTPAFAQADTLRAALQSAYNNNATLNAQRAATRAADEQLPQALSGARPTVTLTGDAGFSRTRTQTFSQGRAGTFFLDGQGALRQTAGTPAGSTTTRAGTNPYGVGITIQQSLFNGFRTINGVRAAKAAIRASRETLANQEQNTLLLAAQAYSSLYFARRLVTIRQRNIAFLSEQLRSAQARLDVGEGTRTDVAQANGRLALGRAQLAAARGEVGNAEGIYFQVIGKRPGQLARPKAPRNLYPRSLNSALAAGLEQHPAIRATRNLVDLAQFNVKIAQGGLLPGVTARGSLSQRSNTQDNRTDTQAASASINVTVPIYQGGRVASQVRESKQLLSQNRIEVEQMQAQVRAEITTAWHQVLSARANVAANTQQVRAAQLALSGVVEERNVGQRTQLDVLDEQTRVLSAQELLLQAQQLEVTAGYRLLAATGRLSSRKLRLQVNHYDPKDHYVAVKDLWFGLRTPSGQ